MNERMLTTSYHITGTLAANATIVDEFPYPVTYLGTKATGSNTNDATLAVSGGATIAATAIGDGSDPVYLQPSSPTAVAKDTAITFTLDFDGAAGTAAANVTIINNYLVGEG